MTPPLLPTRLVSSPGRESGLLDKGEGVGSRGEERGRAGAGLGNSGRGRE